MRILSTALFFSFLLVSSPAFSGENHDHGHSHSNVPITSEDAVKKAKEQVQLWISKGKIGKSWAEAKAVKTEKKTFSKGPEWVVVFKNGKINDVSKQTLYVFYSLTGQYLGANYEGT